MIYKNNIPTMSIFFIVGLVQNRLAKLQKSAWDLLLSLYKGFICCLYTKLTLISTIYYCTFDTHSNLCTYVSLKEIIVIYADTLYRRHSPILEAVFLELIDFYQWNHFFVVIQANRRDCYHFCWILWAGFTCTYWKFLCHITDTSMTLW